MNIYTAIKEVLVEINSQAVVHVFDKSRNESETQNYTGQVVIIDTAFSSAISKTKSLELNNVTRFQIDFLDLDEWDNADNADNNEIVSSEESSFDIIERMQILADSVFWYFLQNEDNYFPLTAQPTWATTPLWRVNSNTMSGVKAVISLPFINDLICNAPLFTVSYRNAAISNAVAGTIATLDFEAKIDTNSDVKFTIDWGTNIGTTIVIDSFTTDVWKPLQSKIFIPLDANVNQLMQITDNFAGELKFNYIVESATLIIKDGSTPGWYIADDLTTITKDASDFVSVWKDKLESGRDLLQAIGTNQPKWFLNDGILFDGIDNFMKAVAFAFVQPEMIYIVFKQITWIENRYIFDGNVGASGVLRQRFGGSSPELVVSSGLQSGISTDLAEDTYGIAKILFNGVNSSFQINENSAIVGDFGTNNMGGFTVGATATPTNFSNIQVQEIILRNVTDTAQDEQDIYDYLAAKYSI